MSMWNGKTDLWGRKTRPSIPMHDTKFSKQEMSEDYVDEQDKIKHLEAQIKFYQNSLVEKCQEIAALNKRLEDSTSFMQTVVLELIQLKNYRPATSTDTKPSTALTEYIKKKNENATSKLP